MRIIIRKRITNKNRTNILYLTAEILYPKAENTNVQMEQIFARTLVF